MATQYVVLYGDPVEGNPTSRMQNLAFEAAGLDWRYLDIRVRAEDLPAAMSAARLLGFGGLNFTIPHKVAAIPLLDGLEPSAEISGACNTVVRQPDGRLIGSNTDGSGFLWSLRDEGIDPAGLAHRAAGRGRCRPRGGRGAGPGRRAAHHGRQPRVAARREALVALLGQRTGVEVASLRLAGPPGRADLRRAGGLHARGHGQRRGRGGARRRRPGGPLAGGRRLRPQPRTCGHGLPALGARARPPHHRRPGHAGPAGRGRLPEPGRASRRRWRSWSGRSAADGARARPGRRDPRLRAVPPATRPGPAMPCAGCVLRSPLSRSSRAGPRPAPPSWARAPGAGRRSSRTGR